MGMEKMSHEWFFLKINKLIVDKSYEIYVKVISIKVVTHPFL